MDGQAIGAFCTIDTKPRAWTDDEVEVLVELAASAQREMELRGAIRQLQEQAVELEVQTDELYATTMQLEERTEAAEAANKTKVSFLSMMSHELRTPLNAIGGYSELIALGVRGPISPEIASDVARIQRASRHLLSLISDILDFTHLDAGQVTYDIDTIRINDILEQAAELLLTQIADAGIVFQQDDCLAANCMVTADRDKLRQIVLNLLTNAIKFTSEGGSVTLSANHDDDIIRIHVADTGRGIPESEQARIFEPFVQLDRDRTPSRNQGVGLGLAISRQLARGMNGDLSVTSKVGLGSTFTITLQAART